MTSPLQAEVSEAHRIYCVACDWQMPLTFAVREQWERWLVAGFKPDDLRLVLKRWSLKIAAGTDPGVLRLSRLIEPTTFAEDLSIAHAERKIRQGPREKAMEQLRPTAVEPRNNGVDTTTARQAMVNGLAQVRRAIEGN